MFLKKYLVWFCLSVYVFSNSPSGELLKIPVLVLHYFEHKTDNKNLSVFEFLYIHYANGDVQDADYAQDMKLPFKKIGKTSLSSLHLECPNAFIFTPQKYEYKATFLSFMTYYNFQYSHTYFCEIWQPPKG